MLRLESPSFLRTFFVALITVGTFITAGTTPEWSAPGAQQDALKCFATSRRLQAPLIQVERVDPLKVMTTLRNIALVLYGAFVLGEQIAATQAGGYTLALAGFVSATHPLALVIILSAVWQAAGQNSTPCEVEEVEPILPFYASLPIIAFLVMLSGLFSGLTLGLMGLDVIGLQIVQKGDDKELARRYRLWHWALPWALAEFLGALLGTYLFAVLRANAEDAGGGGRGEQRVCSGGKEEFLELCAPRRSARLLGELIGTFTYVLTFGLNAVSLSEAGLIGRAVFTGSVCSVADGLAYAAVQVCGGLAAGLLVAVYHMNGPYFFLSFTPLPAKAWSAQHVVQVGLAEGVFTFVLAYVALACSTVAMPKAHKRQNLFFGLAEGFCVMTGGCAVGTFSGGMLNPAVAVGVWMLNVAEIHSIQDGLFFFFPAGNGLCTLLKFSTFQCTGGLLAAVVFRITHPSEYCKAPLLVR
eukprot:g16224.t1